MAIAMMAEMLNLLRSAMSAWIVGKVEAPANANMIEPKAEFGGLAEIVSILFSPLKLPSNVGAGNSTAVEFTFASPLPRNSMPLKTQLTMMRVQATTVVISAPTAMGQKSLGVPAQVSGMSMAATITIHWHRCSSTPGIGNVFAVARCP